MAQKVLIIDQCDPCDHLGLHDVPAVVKHVIQLDKGPVKQYEFCRRCEIAFAPLFEILREHGQEITPPSPVPQKPPRKKAAAKEQPKELEAPTETPTETPTEKPHDKRRDQFIVCPWEHKTNPKGARRVVYTDRNSHADTVHDGAKIWEIPWQDPDGIMTVPCTSHAECTKTGLAFTTPQGLAQHRRSSPLPRIDIEDPDE